MKKFTIRILCILGLSLTGAYAADSSKTDAEYIHALCAEGNHQACNTLGIMFDTGNGVEQNSVQAIALYKKACRGGIGNACYNLSGKYYNGDHVEQSNFQFAYYSKKACDAGVEEGCKNLKLYMEQME